MISDGEKAADGFAVGKAVKVEGRNYKDFPRGLGKRNIRRCKP